MRELLAEGKTEREARNLLVQRALEKYFQNQVLEDILENQGENGFPSSDEDE